SKKVSRVDPSPMVGGAELAPRSVEDDAAASIPSRGVERGEEILPKADRTLGRFEDFGEDLVGARPLGGRHPHRLERRVSNDLVDVGALVLLEGARLIENGRERDELPRGSFAIGRATREARESRRVEPAAQEDAYTARRRDAARDRLFEHVAQTLGPIARRRPHALEESFRRKMT